jgi:hypothetical protein
MVWWCCRMAWGGLHPVMGPRNLYIKSQYSHELTGTMDGTRWNLTWISRNLSVKRKVNQEIWDGRGTYHKWNRRYNVYVLVTKPQSTNGRCRLRNLRKYGKVFKWILNKVGVTTQCLRVEIAAECCVLDNEPMDSIQRSNIDRQTERVSGLDDGICYIEVVIKRVI